MRSFSTDASSPSWPADSITSRRRRSPNSSARPFMASERPSVKKRKTSPLRSGTSASSRISSKRAPSSMPRPRPGRRQHARAPGARLEVDHRVVARARVAHGLRGRVHHRVGHGDERARVEGGGQDAVGLGEQPGRRVVDAREREHEPLQLRHVERGRGPLAGDVRHQHAHARGREGQEVVVVAAHLRRGKAEGGRRAARAGSPPPGAAGSSGSGGRCAAPPPGAASPPAP